MYRQPACQQERRLMPDIALQASEAPVPGQDRIDPDLLGTTYTLALLNGNETAYNLVMGDYLEVMPTRALICRILSGGTAGSSLHDRETRLCSL